MSSDVELPAKGTGNGTRTCEARHVFLRTILSRYMFPIELPETVDGVGQVLAYFVALTKAGVPTEMHIYPQGGHTFGLRPSKSPISKWQAPVERWLDSIGIMSSAH